MQERQEMAQVTQAGINHLVGDKLEEADKKRQEADAIEKENLEKATALRECFFKIYILMALRAQASDEK